MLEEIANFKNLRHCKSKQDGAKIYGDENSLQKTSLRSCDKTVRQKTRFFEGCGRLPSYLDRRRGGKSKGHSNTTIKLGM